MKFGLSPTDVTNLAHVSSAKLNLAPVLSVRLRSPIHNLHQTSVLIIAGIAIACVMVCFYYKHCYASATRVYMSTVCSQMQYVCVMRVQHVFSHAR